MILAKLNMILTDRKLFNKIVAFVKKSTGLVKSSGLLGNVDQTNPLLQMQRMPFMTTIFAHTLLIAFQKNLQVFRHAYAR